VSRVDVAAGTSVKKGDPLLLVEGEKMRGELLAPMDGTVGPVVAAVGTAVEEGDILLRIR